MKDPAPCASRQGYAEKRCGICGSWYAVKLEQMDDAPLCSACWKRLQVSSPPQPYLWVEPF